MGAGRVAVRAVFVESDGGAEPSTEDWQPEQIAAVQSQIATALDWWRARLPNARLTFELIPSVVPSRYEPVAHDLSAGRAGQFSEFLPRFLPAEFPAGFGNRCFGIFCCLACRNRLGRDSGVFVLT